MNVAIIRYNAGNVQSVLFSLQRLGINAVVTDNHDEIKSADKVIFPGVGNAASAMEYLKINNLDKIIISLKQPVLGICLGLQLLCQSSEEGNTRCLNIFDVAVKKFNVVTGDKKVPAFKIPQMGWNTITSLSSPLFENIKEDIFVYFVHSYYAPVSPQTIATTDYTIPYSAAMQKNNFFGVQFHAEKSADAGTQIISNFLKLS